MWHSRPLVLNRGAAEPLGAAESSSGDANLWIWLVFTGIFQLGVWRPVGRMRPYHLFNAARSNLFCTLYNQKL